MHIVIINYRDEFQFRIINRVGQPILVSFHTYKRKEEAIKAARNILKYFRGHIQIVELK